jgi:tetratricopeptide (TPR) repeat protein
MPAMDRCHLHLCLSVVASWLLPIATRAQEPGLGAAVPVDPTELERREDLLGKLVSVDDRVRFYQYHPGQGFDELYLKRTKAVFRLPPALRPASQPRPNPVVVQGIPRKEGERIVVEVTSLRVVPKDLDRLERGVAALPPKDYENRKAWAAWAEKRGLDFGEPALVQRARDIQAEALRLEAEARRGAVDAPGEWLALAEEGRRRKIPEPAPSALAHKAFRARLARIQSIPEANELVAAIERFFPESANDFDAGRMTLGRWEQAYSEDPATAYQTCPAALRKALDRRLWADATKLLLERQAAEDPPSSVQLADRAASLLPERPEFSRDLLNAGLELAASDLRSLRLADVRAMGQAFRDRLDNPQRALELYRDWLKLQRERLSPTDAEGPVALAALYEELLQDRGTAIELLQRAWKIDPGSKEVAEAFRLRGFRRVGNEWTDSSTVSGTEAEDQSPLAPLEAASTLRGRTPEEVTQRLGTKPDRKIYIGTKGTLVEQWIFLEPRQLRYVNFVRTPGDIQPRVVADYFIPRTLVKGEFKPAP